MNYLKGAVWAAAFVALTLLVIVWTAVNYGPGNKESALDAVRSMLNDPESAQFKDVVVGQVYVCGSVNARNRLGGYIGYQRFMTDRYFLSDVGEPAVLENDHLFGPMLKENWEQDCQPDPSSYLEQAETAYHMYKLRTGMARNKD